ncbi:hypothetical protein AB2B38_004745 [Balneola sp. MJW-20]|uniref:hypothetical protein n=1 Tax=Gracilimonas aurantiaca TaxID=3234185 RepID=UPI003464F693
MVTIKKAGYHGILLPELEIGLDYSGTKADHIFISHAHADHMPRNRNLTVYATPATRSFLRQRGFKGEVIDLDFNTPLETDRARITFYPAGHILGSAMTFIESDEGSVLYTGDYKTPPSPASEGFQLPDAKVDQFITEATFALPVYRWDSTEVLQERIRNFAQRTLEEDGTPVFLAYNLGKAQEIMHMLSGTGLQVQIHGAGYKLCSTYDEHGIDLGNYEAYNRDTCEGKVLVCPSSALSNGFASNVRKKRVAYCSGWAAMESRRTQLNADALIPLSDHLDFFELIRLCEELQPELVHVTHTPNPKVVQHYLSERNIKSRYLDLEEKADD